VRTVELAKIATAAEALRLRRIARRQALRGLYGAAAAVFAVAVLVMVHVVLYLGLNLWLSPIVSALIVLVLDVIAAGALGYVVLQSPPDAVEIEAKQIRIQAMSELRRSLTVMGMAAELAGVVLRTGARSGVRRGVAGVAAGLASRLIGR